MLHQHLHRSPYRKLHGTTSVHNWPRKFIFRAVVISKIVVPRTCSKRHCRHLPQQLCYASQSGSTPPSDSPSTHTNGCPEGAIPQLKDVAEETHTGLYVTMYRDCDAWTCPDKSGGCGQHVSFQHSSALLMKIWAHAFCSIMCESSVTDVGCHACIFSTHGCSCSMSYSVTAEV